jgi:hypothetical protein
MNISAPTTTLVRAAVVAALAPFARPGLIGVSCIAEGADSIFAEIVLSLGGELEVILPAADYRERVVSSSHRECFDALLGRAARVRVMPYEVSSSAAYEAANNALLDSCDRLVAVWDGESPVMQGGTSAVVETARHRDLPIEVIWPAGAARG